MQALPRVISEMTNTLPMRCARFCTRPLVPTLTIWNLYVPSLPLSSAGDAWLDD